MLNQIISLNEKISEFSRPVKDVELFGNGYYALTTDDRYTKTDVGTVDFKRVYSNHHQIMGKMSHNMVDVYRLGETNIFMVTKLDSGGTAGFEREIWTSNDKQLFPDEFVCQYEYDFNKDFSKVGFESADGKTFIIGDLKSGKITESVPMPDVARMVKKYGFNFYCNAFDEFRRICPDLSKKTKKRLESTIKQIFPCAITASSDGYLTVVNNNLFYYFDLKQLDVLGRELKSFKPARSDYLGRYYANNYVRMLGLIKKNR